ncbi:B-cell linker protein-like isoform X1 [Seriola dumerili]|uniref:B-cell linker protein-like n=2 Tax=Seriola dumerili TaxID=41447 RepID=A0A3B4VMT5_SERDU|nr:B-cell linker protein-like isoform X1 [Seriola dumerili]
MTMSFFGKLKNLHSGPPAPPKRTDNNAGFGWPQDEFDDEEGDMYEAPPCERPAMKVPQRQVEENVYLERTSSPAVPQRQAAPPPRAGKALKPLQRANVFSYEANTRKPPEIDRTEKPGRNKMMPPPPVRSVPAPVPVSNTEEDVYLDPNEEQEDNDDLYLEPTAACAPAPRGPMRPMPPSPKTALVPSPIPMMKPPVPRAKSNSFLPSLNEVKTAPSVEARRATFPTKLPPPTPSVKPPLPANLKEAKPSPPNHPMAGTKPVASFGGMRATKQSGNESKEWFAGDCNRKTAEDLLQRVNKDGAFLIRHSSAQNSRQPFTLAVLYQQKVYNIPIRFLEETQGYALGKEGKKNEEIFTSLDEMISHHRNNQLLLIDSKSQAKHTAYLTKPARP